MNSLQPTGLEALRLLQEGNDRFRNGLRSVEAFSSHLRMEELAEKGQSPFAIILTCSDSRVPTELVFDLGLGDLFVIRVAGNVEQENGKVPSPNLGALVEMIRPAVRSAIRKNPGITREKPMPAATLENVRQSVDLLLESSQVIRELSASGKLLLTGAIYDIRTGKVQFEGVDHLEIQDEAHVEDLTSARAPVTTGHQPSLGCK